MTTLSVGVRPLRDDAQAVDDAARASTGLRLHDVVLGPTTNTILLRLVGDDRAVGNQQRVVLAAEELQPAEDAGRQELVLVVEHGAAADGAGARR